MKHANSAMSSAVGKRVFAHAVLVVVLFVLLSLVVTYPLIVQLTSAVPGAPGDNVEYVFKQRLLLDMLLQGRLWPISTPNVYYPFGYDLRGGNMTLINLTPAIPVVLNADSVAGYNVIALLSFVLSGLTGYLLGRLLTRQHGPAIIAGILFAFSMYRVYLFGMGHFDHFGTFWVPLVFLYLELAIARRRMRYGALAGLSYAFTGLGSWNFAFIVAMGGAIYVLVRTWPWRFAWSDRRLWVAAISFVTVAVVILAPPAALVKMYNTGGIAFSLADADAFSGDILAWLTGNHASSLAGPDVLRQTTVAPLGWTALTLVCVAAWRQRSRTVLALIVVLAVAIVLTWGPTAHWNGARVYVPVPGVVDRGVARLMSAITERLAPFPARFWALYRPGSIFIPLPAYFLFLFLPLFNSLRESANFMLLADVAAAGLAAVALASVRGCRRPLILTVVAVIAFAELLPAPGVYGHTEMIGQPLVAWLQQHPDGAAVARFPIRKWTNGADLYDGYMSGHPVTDGYVALQPVGWRQVYPLLDRFPADETIALLRGWHVRYIVVAPAAYADDWPQVERRLAALPNVRQVATVPYLSRYRAARLTPAPPTSPTDYVPVAEWIPQPAGTVLDMLRIYELVP